jgi:hypothetical protein
MGLKFKEIKVSQLPPKMVKDIRETIRFYSVAMLIYEDEQNKVVPGSGTLCRIKDKYGILTARHVWNHKKSGIMYHKYLKVVLGRGAYTLESKWLIPLFPSISGNESNCEVPDIAFLQIPTKIASTIESYTKLFYPIDKIIDQYKDHIFNFMGIWFTFGAPIERLNVDERSVPSTTYVTDIGKHTENAEWDYVYLNVIAEKGEMPQNVEGMSGGGVWKAIFSMREDLEEFRLHGVLLSGVNFFQTDIGEKYQILGHGPKSIYKNMYERCI